MINKLESEYQNEAQVPDWIMHLATIAGNAIGTSGFIMSSCAQGVIL